MKKIYYEFLKLIGFTEKYESASENSENKKPELNMKKKTNKIKENDSQFTMKSPIMQIKQLLKALSVPFYDGRILLTIDSPRSTLKFILLNPNICFEEIVSNARSVILAGGTMKPVKKLYLLVRLVN